ncbi:hypothetical protein FALBO_6771 [Fusarium albosuccineum]|uniref:Uncharacterized protein n=1 Tax=Fusarium albosuccineum TaxID=1237068 RepID=A0A8H4PJZ1_9HYPO|nr:hypothetical protein FALBO_6771 [Fusarium albosuccineum]
MNLSDSEGGMRNKSVTGVSLRSGGEAPLADRATLLNSSVEEKPVVEGGSCPTPGGLVPRMAGIQRKAREVAPNPVLQTGCPRPPEPWVCRLDELLPIQPQHCKARGIGDGWFMKGVGEVKASSPVCFSVLNLCTNLSYNNLSLAAAISAALEQGQKFAGHFRSYRAASCFGSYGGFVRREAYDKSPDEHQTCRQGGLASMA